MGFRTLAGNSGSDPGKRLNKAFEERKRGKRRFDHIYVPDAEARSRVQDWEKKSVRATAALKATTLTGADRYAKELRAAFKASGLNAANPLHWRTLLEFFAHAHFEPARKRGTKTKWHDWRLSSLLADYANEKAKHPKFGEKRICAKLVKTPRYKDYVAATLVTKLHVARDPNKNDDLARHLKPILTSMKHKSQPLRYSKTDILKQAREAAIKRIVDEINDEPF